MMLKENLMGILNISLKDHLTLKRDSMQNRAIS